MEFKENSSSNAKSEDFNSFKRKHKVVHKDLMFKGGLIDYRKESGFTDSLIIIKKSGNVKKHYFIKKS